MGPFDPTISQSSPFMPSVSVPRVAPAPRDATAVGTQLNGSSRPASTAPASGGTDMMEILTIMMICKKFGIDFKELGLGGKKADTPTSETSTSETPAAATSDSSSKPAAGSGTSRDLSKATDYKVVKGSGDSLTAIVRDKYFPGKDMKELAKDDNFKAHVAAVAKASGIGSGDLKDLNNKSLRLNGDETIKFPPEAEVKQSQTSKSGKTFLNAHKGNTVNVISNANGSKSVEEFDSTGENNVLSKDVINPKTGKGTHIEYDSDGKMKDDGQFQTEVSTLSDGKIESKYTAINPKTHMPERIYKYFNADGTPYATQKLVKTGDYYGTQQRLIGDDGKTISQKSYDREGKLKPQYSFDADTAGVHRS